MKCDEFNQKVMAACATWGRAPGLYDHVVQEYRDYIDNTAGVVNGYYKWLACAVKVLKPKQVVELGSLFGASVLCMYQELPEQGRLVAVDVKNRMSFLPTMDSRFAFIEGNDLDLSIWDVLEGFDLGATDLWHIDTEHTKDQLTAELKLYKPFFKPGCVVALDDIHMPGMQEVWDNIESFGPFEKMDVSEFCHHSGYGFFIHRGA